MILGLGNLKGSLRGFYKGSLGFSVLRMMTLGLSKI